MDVGVFTAVSLAMFARMVTGSKVPTYPIQKTFQSFARPEYALAIQVLANMGSNPRRYLLNCETFRAYD